MAEWIITSSLLILVAILLRMALKGKISLRLQYVLLAVVLIVLAVGCTFKSGKADLDAKASLRGEYFDFAVRNRLDYVPCFAEGDAPTDSAEYLFYAFAINLDNWGDDKGTMTRDYVDKVIRDHFEVRDIIPASISINKHWNYDGVKYTAVPVGINDKPIYILKNYDETIENGRTVYAVTMDYCVTEEYPLNAEQRQEVRTAVVTGDYGALTAVRTESFRYYVDETTGEPVFLSHLASRPLSGYIKTAARMNYRHIGWDSYTMDEDRIGFVAGALIDALPETLDQTAVQIDNESIVRDYWEQGSCLELVFDGNDGLSYTLLGDIGRSYHCDRMLVCLTKSEDVLFLSEDGVYTHTIGSLDASALKPVYDWLHGMEFAGYMGPDRAEILGQKITVHRNADLDRLPSGYDMRPFESAMCRSLAFCQAAHFRWYELIDRLATDGFKAEIQKRDNNTPSEASDLMQFPRITGVAFPVSVSEPVFLDGDPGHLGVTLGLDKNTTVEIGLAKSCDGRFLIESFKVTATSRFENWELNMLGNLGFGYSVEDFAALAPEQIKSIFVPGALLDGAPAFMPDDAQRAELAAHGITGAQSGVLGNLGYSYEEMLKLSSEEFNFIFPNTELWEKLSAKGYDTKVLRRPEALEHAGYDSFKAVIREALPR
ncbi:MAG: hypothetical protein ACOWWO_06965 [Peptococcaceae bacterium]